MKEDILEQLVDDYLQSEGYFTRHNVKFRPRADHPDFVKNQDSNHSDIDVVAIHPLHRGNERVLVVSCKSWQQGFDVGAKIRQLEENKIVSGRDAWRGFRELMVPKWSEALVSRIEEISGTKRFTYVTAVTSLRGDRRVWEQNPRFCNALGNPIRLLTLSDMLDRLWPDLTNTVASSDIGRLLQLLKAANWQPR